MDPPPLSAGGQPYAARSLFSVIAMAGAVVPCTLSDLIGNRVVMAGFVAWFAAQFGKVRHMILVPLTIPNMVGI